MQSTKHFVSRPLRSSRQARKEDPKSSCFEVSFPLRLCGFAWNVFYLARFAWGHRDAEIGLISEREIKQKNHYDLAFLCKHCGSAKGMDLFWFTILVIPSLSSVSLKLINNPSGLSDNRKYVISCFLSTALTISTDLSSTTMMFSTSISIRKPSSVITLSQ